MENISSASLMNLINGMYGLLSKNPELLEYFDELISMGNNNPEELIEMLRSLQRLNNEKNNDLSSGENKTQESSARVEEKETKVLSEIEEKIEPRPVEQVGDNKEVLNPIPVHWDGNLYGVKNGHNFYTQTSLNDIYKMKQLGSIYNQDFIKEIDGKNLNIFYKPKDIKDFANTNKSYGCQNRDCGANSWVRLRIPCEYLSQIVLTSDTVLQCNDGRSLVATLLGNANCSDNANLPEVLLPRLRETKENKEDKVFFKLLMEYCKVADWEQFDLGSGKGRGDEYSRHKWLNFIKDGKSLDDVSDYLYIAKLFNNIRGENDVLKLGRDDGGDRPIHYMIDENRNKIGINSYSRENQGKYSDEFCSKFINIDMKDGKLATAENIRALYSFIEQDTSESVKKEINERRGFKWNIASQAEEHIKNGEGVRKMILERLNELYGRLYSRELDHVEDWVQG